MCEACLQSGKLQCIFELLLGPLNPTFVPLSSPSYRKGVSITNTVTYKISNIIDTKLVFTRATMRPLNSFLTPLNLLQGLLLVILYARFEFDKQSLTVLLHPSVSNTQTTSMKSETVWDIEFLSKTEY